MTLTAADHLTHFDLPRTRFVSLGIHPLRPGRAFQRQVYATFFRARTTAVDFENHVAADNLKHNKLAFTVFRRAAAGDSRCLSDWYSIATGLVFDTQSVVVEPAFFLYKQSLAV